MPLHVGNIAHGIKHALLNENPEIMRIRLTICRAGPCPHYREVLGVSYCSGCYCPSQTRLRVIKEKCPINKW